MKARAYIETQVPHTKSRALLYIIFRETSAFFGNSHPMTFLRSLLLLLSCYFWSFFLMWSTDWGACPLIFSLNIIMMVYLVVFFYSFVINLFFLRIMEVFLETIFVSSVCHFWLPFFPSWIPFHFLPLCLNSVSRFPPQPSIHPQAGNGTHTHTLTNGAMFLKSGWSNIYEKTW